jgi:rhamnose transport system substrate-binding protein
MTQRTITIALGFGLGLATLAASAACHSSCVVGSGSAGGSASSSGGGQTLTVAMMPKNKGNPYFVSCKQGADEAAQQLGVRLLWDGPTETDPAKQNDVVEAWITRGVQAIAVSVENREAMSTVLRKAKSRGIKVVTWDADADPDARDVFVNQATPRGIAEVLLDHANRLAGGSGEIAIITGSLTAANQNSWIAEMRTLLKEKYPQLTLVDIRPSDDDRKKAFDETQTLLRVHPKVKVILAIASPAVPGAAEAVKQSGRKDVGVTGLGLPNASRPYLEDGVLDSAVLWNTKDLGYLTVQVATALAKGQKVTGTPQFEAGRLGRLEVKGDNVILGTPFTFTKANVRGFDF